MSTAPNQGGNGRDPRRNGSTASEVIELLPGLARVAASAWWHSTEWAMGTSIRTSARLLEAASSPAKAGELVREARGTARNLLRDLIHLAGLGEVLRDDGPAVNVAKKVAEAVPFSPQPDDASQNGSEAYSNGVPRSLREEGEQLLRRSRDVHYEEQAHPAYERILSELAPDEGRILRLLLLEGPQPSVDIRTGGPVGVVKSRLVAPGLSMIGPRAGCRYVERVPSYLNNLFRLGLIWFSRETLKDPSRYQVLEAQPDVLEAIHSVSHAKVVRRSIHLTPFGEDFCRVCLTPETTNVEELPPHSVPPEDKVITQPPAVGDD
jgi:Abortive infection alpha